MTLSAVTSSVGDDVTDSRANQFCSYHQQIKAELSLANTPVTSSVADDVTNSSANQIARYILSADKS